MFGTADPGPRIAFLGSFGGLRPFGAELAITAFGLACQQMKQAGTLTNEQSSARRRLDYNVNIPAQAGQAF